MYCGLRCSQSCGMILEIKTILRRVTQSAERFDKHTHLVYSSLSFKAIKFSRSAQNRTFALAVINANWLTLVLMQSKTTYVLIIMKMCLRHRHKSQQQIKVYRSGIKPSPHMNRLKLDSLVFTLKEKYKVTVFQHNLYVFKRHDCFTTSVQPKIHFLLLYYLLCRIIIVFRKNQSCLFRALNLGSCKFNV